MKASLEYDHLIRQLFALVADGKIDSDEAKQIRQRLFEMGGKVSSKTYDRGIQLGVKLYKRNKGN